MSSLGPSRRSRNTLVQTIQAASTGTDGCAHRNRVVATTGPSSSAYNKSKPTSPSRNPLQLRHVPLYVFSLATFLYVYMINLHIVNTRDSYHDLVQARPSKPLSTTTLNNHPEPIHIIQTRFMQHQPNLLSLGRARLDLFVTFCLPSLKSQVNKNFIWIIRTDPNLHSDLRDKLIALLDGYDNFILLGSNYNPEGFGRDSNDGTTFGDFLRDSKDSEEMTATVFSGNVTLVEEAFGKSKEGAIFLETRLDADDGLHRDFVKTVQSESRHLAVEESGLWRIWCINYNVEWHPLNPFLDVGGTNLEGYLVVYSDLNICVTPGLTFGYGKGASRSNIGARLRHDEITRKITPCTPDNETGTGDATSKDAINTRCFSRLSKLSPGAIRSRTTTSAGMDNVITGDKSHDEKNKLSHIKNNKILLEKFNKQYLAQDKLWRGINVLFHVSRQQSKSAREFIVKNAQKIAEDNFKGQCTPGHSCKNGTQSVLKSVAST